MNYREVLECGSPLPLCELRPARSRRSSSRSIIFLAGLAVIIASPSLRAATLHRFEYNSPHMGTLFSITLYAKHRELAVKAAEAAFHRVADLEQIMSDYREDSELRRLC